MYPRMVNRILPGKYGLPFYRDYEVKFIRISNNNKESFLLKETPLRTGSGVELPRPAIIGSSPCDISPAAKGG
jgi:hypothetical protein